jgi:uncharacterized membrane protein (UPF0136 family)
MGIILAGTGIGGVAWPLAYRYLIESEGFRNTLRITAGIAFILVWDSGVFIRWRANQLTGNQAENVALARSSSFFRLQLVNWRVVRSRKFIAHALGAALQSAAYYPPCVLLRRFRPHTGILTGDFCESHRYIQCRECAREECHRPRGRSHGSAQHIGFDDFHFGDFRARFVASFMSIHDAN